MQRELHIKKAPSILHICNGPSANVKLLCPHSGVILVTNSCNTTEHFALGNIKVVKHKPLRGDKNPAFFKNQYDKDYSRSCPVTLESLEFNNFS